MNEEIKALYEADQAERENWSDLTYEAKLELTQKDVERRSIVSDLIESNTLAAAEDYYHAAMVFQHGNVPEDFLKARDLAKEAFELGDKRGLWLYAAASDRYLTNTKAPFQKYGTQYKRNKDSNEWYLYPVDPETTDEERAKYRVPPLEEILRRENEMNRKI